MKNILSFKLAILLAGCFLFLASGHLYGFSPEVFPTTNDSERTEAVTAAYATITIIKSGPGSSPTTNDLSYGATVHTTRGSFTSSLNPSNYQVTYTVEAGTHTVTKVSVSSNPNNIQINNIQIMGCVESSMISLLQEGTKFTLEEGGNYLMVMSFVQR